MYLFLNYRELSDFNSKSKMRSVIRLQNGQNSAQVGQAVQGMKHNAPKFSKIGLARHDHLSPLLCLGNKYINTHGAFWPKTTNILRAVRKCYNKKCKGENQKGSSCSQSYICSEK